MQSTGENKGTDNPLAPFAAVMVILNFIVYFPY
jgi:hypothetical protein